MLTFRNVDASTYSDFDKSDFDPARNAKRCDLAGVGVPLSLSRIPKQSPTELFLDLEEHPQGEKIASIYRRSLVTVAEYMYVSREFFKAQADRGLMLSVKIREYET